MKDILTIAFPVYERFTYFEDAIQSVLDQTVPCKIIIVDQSKTHTLFKDYVKKLDNPLIKYYHNDTPGMFENMNKCIELSDTPWISILHDDDQLHCQFVENAKRIIDIYGEKIGAFAVKNQLGTESTNLNVKMELNGEIRLLTQDFFLFKNLSPFPGVVFKKEAGLKAGCFDPAYYPISDLYFWHELSKISKIINVDQILSFYRISPEQTSSLQADTVLELTFQFRDKLLISRKNASFLTNLAVEKANLDLINYFLNTYPEFEYSNPRFKNTSRLLKIRGVGRLLNYQREKLSYANLKEL